MPSKAENQRNQEIQQDVLSGRKFSLAELIVRQGGTFLKGESPVPKLVQAVTEINTFIAHHLRDSCGALQYILQQWVKADQATVSKHLDSPLVALNKIIQRIVNNKQLLYELVREVDFRWGQISGDRPHFQSPGQTPHPDDEYTHESVNLQLLKLLESIDSQK